MLEWEENLFQTLSADIFGFNALQIGFSEINALKDSRIKNRWVEQPVLSGTNLPQTRLMEPQGSRSSMIST